MKKPYNVESLYMVNNPTMFHMTISVLTARTFFCLISLLILLPSHNAVAEQLVYIDGREVVLKDDGTWSYNSNDRFANTKDGQRVRLSDDGRWVYVGNAPLTTEQHIRTAELGLKLQKVVIETYEKKVQKNTRVRTQTVFYLQLDYSAQAHDIISINQKDLSHIQVVDNNGKNYPVLSIHTDSAELKPGTEHTIMIRADKSPSIWDEVKAMEIILKPGIFGLKQELILSQKVTDFENRKVHSFKHNNQ